MKKTIWRTICMSLIFLAGFMMQAHHSMAQSMVLDGATGSVTQNEIDKFKAYMQAKVSAPDYNGGNIWVYGNSGKALEACGLMYETTNDIDILNRMIYYADAALAGRNDLASAVNGGQKVTWTGAIDPIWPSGAVDVSPAGAGVEQGEVLSHMLYCAKLILQNPSIWNIIVPDSDPNGFGSTYKQRAVKYVTEADYVMDN
ncbi:hypothetical protein FW774_12435 [Pedobacter sp. BS3]|uniref:hypothetical protein n=1 Tax=Pedobacter sp. BS3 TaxID=2567937 RepID=UPI0011EDE53A|nr:hypothetical protein [Pedobacter sp. BS3]TZF83102.1 hypothetical protein FW774_12435 [Pedobacter sp. BS3]